MIWPYVRLARSYPRALPTLPDVGLDAAQYANPDTRIPHRLAIDLLNASVASSGDSTLGLRAAELIEPGDFDVLEYAARSSATLRESIQCIARYTRLMHDAAEVTLEETRDLAILRYRVTDGVPQPPATNDFVTSVLVRHGWQYAGRKEPLREIQFTHAPTSYLLEYARIFDTKITFGAPRNAIVVSRAWLDTPLVRANPRVSAAFERQVRHLLGKLQENHSIAGRVRELLFAQLSHGDTSMESVARKLAMSVATLRRRLAEEHVSFSEIVDGLREELARRYLSEQEQATSEVAFLLGFSDVVAFHKAFRRWTGMTPAEFRKRAQHSESGDALHEPAEPGQDDERAQRANGEPLEGA